MTIKAFIQNLWKTTYIVHALILCELSFLLTLFAHQPIAALVFYLIAFSTFDRILFPIAKAAGDIPTLEYRITQTMMQTVLGVLVYQAVGFLPALGCTVAWWFATCDKLYYIIGRDTYSGDYPWLEGWSVFAVLKLFGIHATDRTFNIAAIVGLLLGITLCLI